MSVFNYKARKPDGQITRGTVEAPSEKIAEETLRDQGLVVISLSSAPETTILSRSINILSGVKKEEVSFFARQLSVMIGAAVPLVRALRILVKQQKRVSFKIILANLAEEVDGGAKLSQAMSKYPKVFDNFFVYMIKSGETTGRLEEVLGYLSEQKEKDVLLLKRIRNALIYPAFVILALIGVGIFVMVRVVPQLLAVIKEGNGELPIMTRILVAGSDFLQGFWWTIPLVLAVLVVVYILIKKSPAGAKKIDAIKLRLPIMGDVYQKICLTRFAQSFSTLLKSGVPLTQSLQIVSDVVGNRLYKDLILKTVDEVEAGNSISTVFVSDKRVPLILNQMLIVGEETGKMDKVLEKISSFYAKEVDNSVNALVNLIEPLVIAIIGVGVIILVVGIMVPIYSLSSTIT